MRYPRAKELLVVRRCDMPKALEADSVKTVGVPPREIIDFVSVHEWRLIRTTQGSVHIVGRFPPRGRFNASLPISSLELRVASAMTGNGKRLKLVGAPGGLEVAACVTSMYSVFDPRLREAEDVTDAYMALAKTGPC